MEVLKLKSVKVASIAEEQKATCVEYSVNGDRSFTSFLVEDMAVDEHTLKVNALTQWKKWLTEPRPTYYGHYVSWSPSLLKKYVTCLDIVIHWSYFADVKYNITKV